MTSLDHVNIESYRPKDGAHLDLTGEHSTTLDAKLIVPLLSDVASWAVGKYPNLLGHDELRNSVQLLSSDSTREVLITNGASEAIFIALSTLLKRGDVLALAEPAFPGYYNIARLLGLRVITYRADSLLDLTRLARQRKAPKLVILNYPHNPSGFIPELSEYSSVLEQVIQSGAWIVVDETYNKIVFSRHEAILHQGNQHSSQLVYIGSYSKQLGLAGVRIGHIRASQDIIRAMQTIKLHLSMGTNLLTQICLLHLLPQALAKLSELLNRINQNYIIVKEFISRRDPTLVVQPLYGGKACAITTKAMDDSALLRHLQDFGLFGLPGSCFYARSTMVRLTLDSPNIRNIKQE